MFIIYVAKDMCAYYISRDQMNMLYICYMVVYDEVYNVIFLPYNNQVFYPTTK